MQPVDEIKGSTQGKKAAAQEVKKYALFLIFGLRSKGKQIIKSDHPDSDYQQILHCLIGKFDQAYPSDLAAILDEALQIPSNELSLTEEPLSEPKPLPSVSGVLRGVCQIFQINEKEIIERASPLSRLSRARAVAIYILKADLHKKYGEIAEVMGIGFSATRQSFYTTRDQVARNKKLAKKIEEARIACGLSAQ